MRGVNKLESQDFRAQGKHSSAPTVRIVSIRLSLLGWSVEILKLWVVVYKLNVLRKHVCRVSVCPDCDTGKVEKMRVIFVLPRLTTIRHH